MSDQDLQKRVEALDDKMARWVWKVCKETMDMVKANDEYKACLHVVRRIRRALLAAGTEEPVLRELAKQAAEGGKAAADELMTEFISKKRAANWGVVNDGLLACDKLLAALAARPVEGENK